MSTRSMRDSASEENRLSALAGIRNACDSSARTRADIDPLLMRLIELLPAPGTEWPALARQRWLRTFTMNADLVYGVTDAEIPSSKG